MLSSPAPGKNVELPSSDIDGWNITLVDTRITSNIGQRLRATRRELEPAEMFRANYTDCLLDVPLPGVIESFKNSENLSFVGVKARGSFHPITMQSGCVVASLEQRLNQGRGRMRRSWSWPGRFSLT